MPTFAACRFRLIASDVDTDNLVRNLSINDSVLAEASLAIDQGRWTVHSRAVLKCQRCQLGRTSMWPDGKR